MKSYFVVFIKDFIRLNSIDILIFSIIVSINIGGLTRETQIILSSIIIKKSLLNHIQTKSIGIILFLSGSKLKRVFLLNFVINNAIFLIVTIIIYFLGLLKPINAIENLIVLNILINISFILKYFISFHFIKDVIIVNLIKSSIYFSFLWMFSFNIELTCLILILSYFLIINIYNKAIEYNDIC